MNVVIRLSLQDALDHLLIARAQLRSCASDSRGKPEESDIRRLLMRLAIPCEALKKLTEKEETNG